MKNMKRIISAALCLCMIAVTLVVLAACNVEPETPTDKDDTVSVLVATKDIEADAKITDDMFKTVTLDVADVPLNAIRDAAKVKDMITTQKIYSGEFFFRAKLIEKKVEVSNEYSANLVVTEYIELNGDVADKLQKLIDDNPGRTLEFPDGEYLISKPLKISADCAKAVSLRLSEYAVIKAADSWTGSEAMVCLASGTRNEESDPLSFDLKGGIIDGNGKAAVGVSADDARDILISDVVIKNVTVGIEIKGGAVDIENVDIKGDNTADSVGMIIGGDDSSAANVMISDTETGVKVSGYNNVFKSVNVKYSGTSSDSCGFIDSGKGSKYDMCQSYRFATGFKMSENTNSVYYACYVTWTDETITRNWAFQSEGKFNSFIRTSRADFAFTSTDSAFIKVGAEGGAGQILYPMIEGLENIDVTDYTNYLAGTAVVKR